MSIPAYPVPSYNTPTNAPIEPPPTVRYAFYTYLAAAAVSLIGIVLTLSSDIWQQAIGAAGSQIETSGMSTDTVITIAKTTTIVFGLLFLALYLLFAFKMRAGRNWARVVLTVLSALSIVSVFSSQGSVTVNGHTYSAAASQLTGWLGAILAVAAIVLMYLTASNLYFATVKAARTVN